MSRSTRRHRGRVRGPGRRPSPVACGALASALLAAGCGGNRGASADGADAAASPTPHGYVAGAAELPEPQLQLAYVDGAGSMHALDLLTEESADLGSTEPVSAVASDGRFVFSAAQDGPLTVVDTGTWTVDHGDHVHYYRAPARTVGDLEWTGDVRAASSETLTALFSPTTGTGVVLDRAALGEGELEERAEVRTEPHAGVLVPLGDRLVSTDGASVRALDADGEPLPGAVAECADPRGGRATRVGVAVSCADGAVLATETDDGVAFERIPYPTPVGADRRAGALDNRPGRPSLAAPAGRGTGVWVLDTRARSWQLLPTEAVWVQAVAADDDHDRVVGVDAAGRVVVLDPEAGTSAATEPLLPVDRLDEVDLQVDADRAYVNVPGGTQLHEVDYADGARLARTLSTAVAPDHLAETGR